MMHWWVITLAHNDSCAHKKYLIITYIFLLWLTHRLQLSVCIPANDETTVAMATNYFSLWLIFIHISIILCLVDSLVPGEKERKINREKNPPFTFECHHHHHQFINHTMLTVNILRNKKCSFLIFPIPIIALGAEFSKFGLKPTQENQYWNWTKWMCFYSCTC